MGESSVRMSSTGRVPRNWEPSITLNALATLSAFVARSSTTRAAVLRLLRSSSPQKLSNTTIKRLLRPSLPLRVCTLDNKFLVVRTPGLLSVTSFPSAKSPKVPSSATSKKTWVTVAEWPAPLELMSSLFLTTLKQTRLVSSCHLARRNWSARPLVLWSVLLQVVVVLISHS